MKKKLLFVTPHMISGGVEKALISLVNEIPLKEFEVTILMVKAQGDFLPLIPKFVKYGELPLPNNIAEELLMGGATASIIKMIKRLRIFQAFKIFINKTVLNFPVPELGIPFNKIPKLEEKFDIAVAFHLHMPFIVNYVSEKVYAEKKIAWIHNDFKVSGFNPKKLKKNLDNYSQFYVVSKQLKEEYLELMPEYNYKTDIFYNIISTDLIKKMSKDDIKDFGDFDITRMKILTIGRLDKQKGIDLAIKVSKRLIKDGYKFTWYIIGEGVERKNLEGLIKRYKLEKYFILLGLKVNPYPYLNLCDIYVQPSRHEGYCLTLAEARCLNKPIITTDFAGAKEQIVNNETGLIIKFNEEILYSSLKSLIDNENLRARFQKKLSDQNLKNTNELEKFLNFLRE